MPATKVYVMSFLRKNNEEIRITIPFKMYTITTIKASPPAPNPALSNIEAIATVVKKIIGVSSKNMKPAMILLFKLCCEREMAKKFRMLNITITKRKIINNCIPSDISTPPCYR